MVAAIGQELTKERMASKDEAALRIAVGGTVYYAKQPPSVGHYKTRYGDIQVRRHLYQTAHGGATLCPLERNGQMERFGSDTPLRVIATGMDGATMPLVDENYKMAMVGTIALYDTAGERRSTEYLGAMPEAGRESFYQHFDA